MSVAASRRRPPVALAAAGVLVAALAALPLAYLLVRAVGAEARAWDVVLRAETVALIGRTALLVGLVTAAAAVLGVGLAWLVVRSDLPGRGVLAVAAALPLVIPSYVVALAFIAAFGPGGLLGEGTWLFGLPGAWLALTLATYPYVFLLCAAALRRMDPELEEAARGLGRTRAQVFREVTLPVLRPSVGAGSVLVALYALSDFGVVSLMRYDALTRAVYQQYRSLFDRTPAAILGLVLVLLTAVVLLAEARGRGRGSVARASAGAARPADPAPLGRWRWPALAACLAVLTAALVVPVGTLLSWSARAGQDRADLGELLGWAWNSVAVSGLAAAAATAAALPVAALAVRWGSGWTRGLERATYAANALPGIVIALALVFFATRAATSIYQTLPLLVFAYVVRFLPQALAGTEDALGRVDPQLEQAARGLGASPRRVFARITAPLVAPGLLAGATLVFLSTMKELPVTLLLRPIGYDTLATEVWTATGVSAYAEAALPALALIVLSAPVVYGLQLRRRPARAALVPQE
ncbi:MAG: Ferric iron ABC transporter, permease protein [uncultured Solirubrobacteraceae bacterium]|uniref:Ferric iron ABC transporter, permease protein n=1 Tax=uncultured Solirubrobacteraceae bacterium TaxID=1162706 RepID=A0A6J4TEA1_9ACTN|nr:MAG: Ferric iron ABC transporter, permease protein [uncultured Solirubrobacteraceae bacterium]